MPPIERENLHQTYSIFLNHLTNKFNEPIWSDAQNITLRFEENRREMLDPMGNPLVVDATAYVSEEDDSSWRPYWIGSLVIDAYNTTYPPYSPGTRRVFQVVAIELIPDLKNRHTQITLGLIKYSKSIPEANIQA